MKDKNCLKIGIRWKRALMGVLCLLAAGLIFQTGYRLVASRSVVWFVITYLLGLAGIALLLVGCARTYKVDHTGITTYYFKLFDFFIPWGDCNFLGTEKLIYLHILCIKNGGGYALNIPYDEKIFAEIREYVPEHITVELWKKEKKKSRVEVDASKLILRDTPGEMVIDTEKKYRHEQKTECLILAFLFGFEIVMMAVCMFIDLSPVPILLLVLLGLVYLIIIYDSYQNYGRNFIINREGIITVSHGSHRRRFYAWQDFERIGVYFILGTRDYGGSERVLYSACRGPRYGFWIWCRTRRVEYPRRIMIEYTKERYEQFLNYVPEGAITDPLTQQFQIEWMKRVKFNKGR